MTTNVAVTCASLHPIFELYLDALTLEFRGDQIDSAPRLKSFPHILALYILFLTKEGSALPNAQRLAFGFPNMNRDDARAWEATVVGGRGVSQSRLPVIMVTLTEDFVGETHFTGQMELNAV